MVDRRWGSGAAANLALRLARGRARPSIALLLAGCAAVSGAGCRERDGEAARAAAAAARDNLPIETPLVLDVGADPPLRGSAPTFAECRVLQIPGGSPTLEVATTTAEFETGGPAALGVVVTGYLGPGSYTEGVTVTIARGANRSQPDLLAAREGCVARVEDAQRGSFSCERLSFVSSVLVDTLGVTGSGSWVCWR